MLDLKINIGSTRLGIPPPVIVGRPGPRAGAAR